MEESSKGLISNKLLLQDVCLKVMVYNAAEIIVLVCHVEVYN